MTERKPSPSVLEIHEQNRQRVAEIRRQFHHDQADAAVEQMAERRARYTRRLATLERVQARVDAHRARLERQFADVIA